MRRAQRDINRQADFCAQYRQSKIERRRFDIVLKYGNMASPRDGQSLERHRFGSKRPPRMSGRALGLPDMAM